MQFEQANDLLDKGYLPFESGYKEIGDGKRLVAALTRMPGCGAKMVHWWFSWLGGRAVDGIRSGGSRPARVSQHCASQYDSLAAQNTSTPGRLEDFVFQEPEVPTRSVQERRLESRSLSGQRAQRLRRLS